MSWREAFAARRGYFLVSAGVLFLDQVTKVLAGALLRGHGPVEVIPRFFNLIYSRNRGGLFGYFATLDDPWRTALLTAVPLAAVVLIGLFLARTSEPDRSTLTGLALILGGAAGNLVDRVVHGEVVDFLDVYASWRPAADWLRARFHTSHWPTFNLADSAIVIGAALLLLDILRPERKSAEKERGAAPR